MDLDNHRVPVVTDRQGPRNTTRVEENEQVLKTASTNHDRLQCSARFFPAAERKKNQESGRVMVQKVVHNTMVLVYFIRSKV